MFTDSNCDKIMGYLNGTRSEWGGMEAEVFANFGIDELKTPTLKVNFRKSESIEIENEDLIDDKFKVEKVTKSISKTLIKEAIKNGENVLGANISVNYNLQIK